MGVRLLLDTHALAWWFLEEDRLPEVARDAIIDPHNEVFVSAVAVWEAATKHRLGKWPKVEVVLAGLEAVLARSRFQDLPISLGHAKLAGSMISAHRDPFDRMLAAQSLTDYLVLVSGDPVFPSLGVRVLWTEPKH